MVALALSLAAFESFYSRTFGWEFTDYGSEYRAFSDGALEGGIYKSELQSRTSAGAALIVLYADDLEATQERVVAIACERWQLFSPRFR